MTAEELLQAVDRERASPSGDNTVLLKLVNDLIEQGV